MADPIHGDPKIDREALKHVKTLETFLFGDKTIKNLDQRTLRSIKRSLGHMLVDIDFNLDQRNEQGRGGLKSSISHLKKKVDNHNLGETKESEDDKDNFSVGHIIEIDDKCLTISKISDDSKTAEILVPKYLKDLYRTYVGSPMDDCFIDGLSRKLVRITVNDIMEDDDEERFQSRYFKAKVSIEYGTSKSLRVTSDNFVSPIELIDMVDSDAGRAIFSSTSPTDIAAIDAIIEKSDASIYGITNMGANVELTEMNIIVKTPVRCHFEAKMSLYE